MLEVTDLSVHYGLHRALDGVSLQVHPGELVAMLGANGAGKSSLLKALGGMLPAQGSIRLDGGELASQPAQRIVEAGLARAWPSGCARRCAR